MQGVPPWKILSTVLLTKEPKFASYLHCWLEFTVAESTYLSWKQSSKISICTFTNYLQGQNQLYLQNSISVGFFWFFGCFFFFYWNLFCEYSMLRIKYHFLMNDTTSSDCVYENISKSCFFYEANTIDKGFQSFLQNYNAIPMVSIFWY